MVTIGHVIAEAQAHLGAAVSPGSFPWTWGVDLFFVISGAVIVISAARQSGRPGGWRRFLAARVIRVVPLYWMFTALMLGALLAAPQHVHSVALDWGQVAASFAFVPYQAANGLEVPILTPGWTLNYEIFFYATVTLLLAVGLRIGSLVLALTAGFAGIVVAGWLAQPDAMVLRFWSDPLILEFVLGAGIGWAWLRRGGAPSSRPWFVALTLVGLGLAGLWVGRGIYDAGLAPRALAAGLPSALIVAAAVLFCGPEAGRRTPRWAVALGDSSYALYLSHRFTLRGLTLLWPSAATGWLFVMVASLAAIAVGHAVYLVAERPLLRTCRKRWLPRARPA
jgi:peptidoglycan/LPS O-acetylase OafA/YrhL